MLYGCLIEYGDGLVEVMRFVIVVYGLKRDCEIVTKRVDNDNNSFLKRFRMPATPIG